MDRQFAILTLMFATISGIFSICQAHNRTISIYSAQVSVIPIGPEYFDWAPSEERGDYSYEAALTGAPDLPHWINYTYSTKHRRGYLYGVVPREQRNFELEIVALDRRTYETRDARLEVQVIDNDNDYHYQVQLRINNWNIDDMFDNNRTDVLFDVIRKAVWRNATDLQLTFLVPSIAMGARYPLNPGEQVGTVIRIGSSMPFSSDLLKLEKELEPTIKKMSSCSFKKASIERFFKDIDVRFDWCYFRLLEDTSDLQEGESARSEKTFDPLRYPGIRSGDRLSGGTSGQQWQWRRVRKIDVPHRNYRRDVLASFVVPSILLLVVVGFLSTILCLHSEDLIMWNEKKTMENCRRTNGVQMIHYAPPIGCKNRSALRSLSSAHRSTSPTLSETHSLARSPRSAGEHGNSYIRPNPPPYVSPNSYNCLIRSDF